MFLSMTRIGVAGLALALLLTGCSAATELDAAETSTPAAIQTPSETPAPSPNATETPTAEPVAEATEEPSVEPMAEPAATCPESTSTAEGLPSVVAPYDLGPQPGATGTGTAAADGTPCCYVVAEGDTVAGIAASFCVDEWDIAHLNAVRRNGPYAPNWTFTNEEERLALPLFAGDTLNLNPHTIFTGGDENGVVYDYTGQDITWPEQW